MSCVTGIQGELALQNITSYRPESIGRSFLSLEALAAVICMFAFWTTITSFDAEIKAGEKGNEHTMDTPEVVQKAESLKPMQLARAGQYPEAEAAARELLKKNSHDVVSNLCAGNVFILAGSTEDGLKLIKKAVALAPRNRYVRFAYASKLADMGNYPEAIAQYQILSKAHERWVDPHMQVAQILLKQDKNAEAADEFGTIVTIDSNNSLAYKMHGLCLARAGRGSDGMDEYIRGVTIENQSGLPDALKALVSDWGTVDRAIYELQQQVNNRPDDYVPKLRLAQLFANIGQGRDAKDLLLDARREAPSNPEVHRTLAVVLKKLGENNQALSEFMLSVALEKAQQKQDPPKAGSTGG